MIILYEVEDGKNLFNADLMTLMNKTLNSLYTSIEEEDEIFFIDSSNLLNHSLKKAISDLCIVRHRYIARNSAPPLQDRQEIVQTSSMLLASHNALHVIRKTLPFLKHISLNDPAFLYKTQRYVTGQAICLGFDRYWKCAELPSNSQFTAFINGVGAENHLYWDPMPAPFSLINHEHNRSPYFDIHKRWNEV